MDYREQKVYLGLYFKIRFGLGLTTNKHVSKVGKLFEQDHFGSRPHLSLQRWKDGHSNQFACLFKWRWKRRRKIEVALNLLCYCD